MPYRDLSRDTVREVLATSGFDFALSGIQIEARDERWLVRLPEGRLAWFAASARGRHRLRIERRVLRLIESRCTFSVPSVLFETPDGDIDIRRMVPGSCDPRSLFSRLRDDTEYARRVGREVGAMLAEQHSRIGAVDAEDWLPRRPEWPEPREWVSERISRVVDDSRLIADADRVLELYEALADEEVDRVLVHTDIGLHNMAFEPTTLSVAGFFDYEGAAWADRHHDFRYLVFDIDNHELLHAAASVYEPRTGKKILRERVLLYNAACAVSYLAYRVGKAPDERWCGRTLAEDVYWSKHAIGCVLDR